MRFTLFFSLFLLIGTAYAQETKEPKASADTATSSDTGKELPVTPDEPMVFDRNADTIFAKGIITPDTPAEFVRFVERHSGEYSFTSINLNSNGGDILSAMALGREIRKRGMNTFAGGKDSTCRDACFWAFLAGNGLYGDNLVLRTYRPPSEEDGSMAGEEDPVRKQQLVDIAYISQYAQEMGFDMRIAYIDWQNPEPHIFTDKEMDDLHISKLPNEFGSFTLQPFAKGLVAMARSVNGDALAMFYCNAKKQPIFQMKGLPLSLKWYFQDISNNNRKGVDFLGFNFPTDKARLVVKNDRVEFTLPLSNFDADKIDLDTSASGFMPTVPYGKGDWSIGFPTFNDMSSLKATARIAMKNCL